MQNEIAVEPKNASGVVVLDAPLIHGLDGCMGLECKVV
jgi:hypothetical protein